MTGTDQEPTLALRLTRQLPASPEVVFEAYLLQASLRRSG